MDTSDMPSADFQDPQLLAAMPPLFKKLSKSIPVQTLLALADKFGGARVHVPKRPNETSRLSSILDPSSFSALTALFGMETINIPRAVSMRRVFRDREIVKLRATGHSFSELALKFSLTQRTIYYVALRQATKQGSSTDAARGH